MAITTQMRTEVSQLYVALFGRAPDGDGLGYWVQLRDQGQSLAQIANTMYATTPARTYFPSFLTNGEIIAAFYTNVLGRTADAEGAAFWTGKLNAAGATPGSVIAEMINTVANYGGTDAAGKDSQALFNNKVTVAQYYGEKNGNVAGATTVLSSVTKDAATVTTTKASIDSGTVGGVNQGQTYTLTSGTDVVTGTGGNDTFVAGVTATAGGNVSTLTAGDSISGGAGTDRLNVLGNANATAFTGATVNGVEQIFAQFDATGGAINVSGNADVTEAWVTKATVTSAGAAAGTAAVTLKKAQVAGIDGAITNTNTTNDAANISTVTFTFTDVAGAADTATLALNAASFVKDAANVKGVTSGVTIAGVETLNISATGTSSIGVLTAANTETLKVTGSGKVTATAAGGTFKTVDASANTGGLVLNIAALAAADLKVTGGTGADEITIDFANLTKVDVIDLGAGTDTLSFATNAVTLNDAATAAQFTGVTNVEALKFTGAIAATIDAARTAITGFNVSTTGVAALSNLQNADAVTIGAVAAGANTFAMELGSNTLALTLAGSATAAANATTQQVVTGTSIVNITSSGTAGVGANTLNIKTADNNLFNVSGSQDLTLTMTNAGGVTGNTVNASTFTGKLDVTGTAQADKITGGTGNDTIRATAGGDNVTLGGGTDTVILTNVNQSTTAATLTITDFVTGSDKLDVSAISVNNGTFSTTAVTVTSATTLTQAIGLAAAGDGSANGIVSYFQFGGDTYVVVDNTAGAYAATDAVIKLTGAVTLAASDIVA